MIPTLNKHIANCMAATSKPTRLLPPMKLPFEKAPGNLESWHLSDLLFPSHSLIPALYVIHSAVKSEPMRPWAHTPGAEPQIPPLPFTCKLVRPQASWAVYPSQPVRINLVIQNPLLVVAEGCILQSKTHKDWSMPTLAVVRESLQRLTTGKRARGTPRWEHRCG